MQKLESHTAPKLLERQRLQEYAVGIFRTQNSRAGIKKAIKKGLVFVDGSLGYTGDWIHGGEIIDLYESNHQTKPSIQLSLEILFEDDFLAVVNKPAGILVSGNKRTTVENGLPILLRESTQQDALQRPEPIHRLDYPTSGALLIGKTATMVNLLNKLFENRNIRKTYHAVTKGSMNAYGTITFPIDEKPSVTEYRTTESITSPAHKCLNLVTLLPQTGRRHQLRKHLFAIGHGIFGDPLYKQEDETTNGRGLYLHASRLEFRHPVSNDPMVIEAPFPKKFLKLFPQSLAR